MHAYTALSSHDAVIIETLTKCAYAYIISLSQSIHVKSSALTLSRSHTLARFLSSYSQSHLGFGFRELHTQSIRLTRHGDRPADGRTPNTFSFICPDPISFYRARPDTAAAASVPRTWRSPGIELTAAAVEVPVCWGGTEEGARLAIREASERGEHDAQIAASHSP